MTLILTDHPQLIEIADVVRAGCAVGAAILIGFAMVLAYRTTRDTPTSRTVTYHPSAARDFALLLLGFALLAVSALFTELGRVGEPVSWRLPFNVLGIALGLVAVTRLLRRVRDGHA